MNNKIKEPVLASTAEAKDTLNVSETIHNATKITNNNGEEHYVTQDGKRLFTSDEVNTLIRERLDRQMKSILSKYELSSKEELDDLVMLSKHVVSVSTKYKEKENTINNMENTNTKELENTSITELTPEAKAVKFVLDKKYINISDLSKGLTLSFTKAADLLRFMQKHGIVSNEGESSGFKVSQVAANDYLASLEVDERVKHLQSKFDEQEEKIEPESTDRIDEILKRNNILTLQNKIDYQLVSRMLHKYDFIDEKLLHRDYWLSEVTSKKIINVLIELGAINKEHTEKGYEVNKDIAQQLYDDYKEQLAKARIAHYNRRKPKDSLLETIKRKIESEIYVLESVSGFSDEAKKIEIKIELQKVILLYDEYKSRGFNVSDEMKADLFLKANKALELADDFIGKVI